ncbi:MAG TPA: hypothetical protein VM537_31510, partial [Anaerolineae bacterium]|nr:hypothetical protein [Anaerolineae bacterium]
LKGIFFIDDRQVAWAQVEKRYAGKDGPGVSVVLERLEGIPEKRPAREQFEGEDKNPLSSAEDRRKVSK